MKENQSESKACGKFLTEGHNILICDECNTDIETLLIRFGWNNVSTDNG